MEHPPTRPSTLLADLFDLSFQRLITLRVIRILYALAIVLAAVGALLFVASGFSRGPGWGLAALVLAPIVGLLYLLAARVYLELVCVLFRIEANTRPPGAPEP